jgi:N-acetylneuraminate epimerase
MNLFSPRFPRRRLLGALTMGIIVLVPMESAVLDWKQLPSLPNAEGFASAFTGVSHDALLVAGGANFPRKRPWEGGTKSWYDTVFVLSSPNGAWHEAGKLPQPTAYGVSITTDGGVVCLGGGNAVEQLRNAYVLTWDGQRLRRRDLPSLPEPVAFGSGAAVGKKIYLFGGITRPDATDASANFWTLDLRGAHPAWAKLPPCPGPARMLAQMGAVGRVIYICGGVELHAGADGKAVRAYLADNYAFEVGKGWRRLADLPHAVAAAPSPMAVTATGKLLVVSGDDGTRAQLTGPKHPGFLHEVLIYDPQVDVWTKGPDAPISRATAPTTVWHGDWIVVSGERKPGYRSPEIWSLEAAR